MKVHQGHWGVLEPKLAFWKKTCGSQEQAALVACCTQSFARSSPCEAWPQYKWSNAFQSVTAGAYGQSLSLYLEVYKVHSQGIRKTSAYVIWVFKIPSKFCLENITKIFLKLVIQNQANLRSEKRKPALGFLVSEQ